MARRLGRGLYRPQRDPPTQMERNSRYREKGAGRGPLRDERGRSQEVNREAILLQGPLLPRGRPHPYPTFGRSAGLAHTHTCTRGAAPASLSPTERAAPSAGPGTRDPPSLPPGLENRPPLTWVPEPPPQQPPPRRARAGWGGGGERGGTAETTPTRDHARGSRAPERPRPAGEGSVSS